MPQTSANLFQPYWHFFLLRVPEIYKVNLKKIKIHKDMALRIIKVGIPTAIQVAVISLSNVIMQSSVNAFGPMPMAGFGAFVKIDGFNILPVLSLSLAITTFAGQNYGAGKIDRVKKGNVDYPSYDYHLHNNLWHHALQVCTKGYCPLHKGTRRNSSRRSRHEIFLSLLLFTCHYALPCRHSERHRKNSSTNANNDFIPLRI